MHEVVAIDPAELRLSPMPTNVTHYRMKGQDYLDLITRQQAEDGASKTIDQVRGGPFDVIACDMNLDPVEMLEIMAPLFSLAADGGYLVSPPFSLYLSISHLYLSLDTNTQVPETR